MILFLFGEDAFRIQEKRLALKTAFFEKNPESTGFFEFDFSDGSGIKDLSASLEQAGLFSSKTFVIARNIFDAPIGVRRELAEFLDSSKDALVSDKDRILLFAQQGIPKKNEKLWKSLSVRGVIAQEFKSLSERGAIAWISESVRRYGARSIDTRAATLLLRVCGESVGRSGEVKSVNLFRICAETKKLAAYRYGEDIREEDVRQLLSESLSEQSVFQALDALFLGKKIEALSLFGRLMKQEEPLGLLGLCAWQLRIVMRASHLINEGIARTASELSRFLGIQHFVAEKSLRFASKFSHSKIDDVFSRLVRLDAESKSGGRSPEDALLFLILRS